MRLTSFTDYCLRVLIFTATHPQGRTTIAEIARAYGISEHHLVKVAHFLGRAGFLTNLRGRGGGLALARPAGQINVGAVVRAAEGEAMPAACFDAAAARCAIAPVCRLKGVLAEAVDAFYAVLGASTLGDLVQDRAALRQLLAVPATLAAAALAPPAARPEAFPTGRLSVRR